MTDQSVVVETPQVEPAAVPAPAPESPTTPEAVSPEGEQSAPEKTYSQKEHEEALQKRLAKESRRVERVAYERARRELAEQQLAELRAKHEQPAQQPTAQGEPRPEDFKDYESYVRATARWEVQQEMSSMHRESAAQAASRTAREQAAYVQSRLAPAAQKYSDFAEVALADDLPITQPMAAAIAESDVGGDVAYYLGSHREEAERISKMSAVQQVRELAKIEEKITAPPRVTKAPPPIEPTGGKVGVEKDPDDMSYAEFKKWREKQIAARR